MTTTPASLLATVCVGVALLVPTAASAQSISPDPADAHWFTPREDTVSVQFVAHGAPRMLLAPANLRAPASTSEHRAFRPLCRTPCTLHVPVGTSLSLAVLGNEDDLHITASQGGDVVLLPEPPRRQPMPTDPRVARLTAATSSQRTIGTSLIATGSLAIGTGLALTIVGAIQSTMTNGFRTSAVNGALSLTGAGLQAYDPTPMYLSGGLLGVAGLTTLVTGVVLRATAGRVQVNATANANSAHASVMVHF